MTTAIHMTIRLNGEAVEGEGQGQGEAGFVECLGFTDGITTDQAPTGRSLGRRHPEPIVARKRIDRTTPRLLEALSQNEQVDATFRFYRPTEAGVSEHYFTVEVSGGRIIGIERSWQVDVGAEQEDVRIAPLAVTWTHEPSGATFQSRPRGTA